MIGSALLIGLVIFGLVWAIADTSSRAGSGMKTGIALVLAVAGAIGTWYLIRSLGDPHIPLNPNTGQPDLSGAIPVWIKITCAITMAAGTAAGGWRIIRTMGHKMVKMQPVHGFAAETTAAIILHGTATMGVPVSTTHVISTSIMGVGATKRLSAVKWGVVERIL